MNRESNPELCFRSLEAVINGTNERVGDAYIIAIFSDKETIFDIGGGFDALRVLMEKIEGSDQIQELRHIDEEND